jgi:hypothetical protein
VRRPRPQPRGRVVEAITNRRSEIVLGRARLRVLRGLMRIMTKNRARTLVAVFLLSKGSPPLVERLTDADMAATAAYVASLQP